MYYSVELLSARRRGKFAKCWFAATLNEELFLKKFKSSSIRDTDLIAVCDEILRTICTTTNRRAQRYSLYLSSQLMYGVAKIHYYQINIFQKELFELRIKLERVEISDGHSKKKRRLNLSEIEEYTVPEPLTLNLVFSDIGEQDFHILREDSGINAKLQNLMQDADCLNFGALTNMELEELLMQNEMTVSEPVMLLPGENGMDSESIIGREIRVAEVKSPSHDDLKRGKERHTLGKRPTTLRMSRGSPVLPANTLEHRGFDINISVPDDVEEPLMGVKPPDMPSIGMPETPNKRLSKHPEVDTPTKRRRFEDEFLEEAHPVESTVIPGNMQNFEMHLEPIDVDFIRSMKRLRRPRHRIFADTRIKIPTGTLQAMINDVNVHTVAMKKRLITSICENYLSGPEKLFKTPATIMESVRSRKWANELYSLFENPTIAEIHAETYQELTITKPLSASLSTEVMRRADTINQTEEFSSHISRKDKQDTTDKTKLEEQSIPFMEVERAGATMPEISVPEMHDVPENANGIQIAPMEPEVPIMEINESEEKDEFLPPLMRKSNIQRRMQEKLEKNALETSSLSSVRSIQTLKRQWIKEDFLATLEVLWYDKQAIKFVEICSPSHNTKIDAADCFKFCIELSVSKRLSLTQRAPYHNIWITKIDYSSGSTTSG